MHQTGHSKSLLSMRQDQESKAFKIREGILKNPLINANREQAKKNRYGTSNQKHRQNIFFDQSIYDAPKGITMHTQAARQHGAVQSRRKVLNIYKDAGVSKHDIFIANVAKQTIDQDSRKQVDETVADLKNDLRRKSNGTPEPDIKSILRRYKHKQSDYQTNGKLSAQYQSQMKTT